MNISELGNIVELDHVNFWCIYCEILIVSSSVVAIWIITCLLMTQKNAPTYILTEKKQQEMKLSTHPIIGRFLVFKSHRSALQIIQSDEKKQKNQRKSPLVKVSILLNLQIYKLVVEKYSNSEEIRVKRILFSARSRNIMNLFDNRWSEASSSKFHC